jgi:hypothetical protein
MQRRFKEARGEGITDDGSSLQGPRNESGKATSAEDASMVAQKSIKRTKSRPHLPASTIASIRDEQERKDVFSGHDQKDVQLSAACRKGKRNQPPKERLTLNDEQHQEYNAKSNTPLVLDDGENACARVLEANCCPVDKESAVPKRGTFSIQVASAQFH